MIAVAQTPEKAIARMDRALREFRIQTPHLAILDAGAMA